MLRLMGIPLPDPDGRRLVATLIDVNPELAARLATALDRGTKLLALALADRDAIFATLEEAETEHLAELRGRLADDVADRHGL